MTIVSVSCAANALSTERSFFMTAQESSKILAISKRQNTMKKESNKKFKISGIFYINEENWTIWINGVAYSTIGQQRDFSINSVTANEVSLTLEDGAMLVLSVTTDDPHDTGDTKPINESNT
ncbi:MAG: hypothetical protein LBI20_03310 [Holosporales bacterium]|jgi:hypothetical protein|nr:hypothetical protein [Holosporales bacterium]